MCIRNLLLNHRRHLDLKVGSLARVTSNYVKRWLLRSNQIIYLENINFSRKSLDFGCHILIFQMFLSVLKFLLSFRYTSFVYPEKNGRGAGLHFCNIYDKAWIHFVKITNFGKLKSITNLNPGSC